MLFGRAGCNVVITARREDALKQAAKDIEQANKDGQTGKGGKVFCLKLDMQDIAAVSSVLDKLPADFKDIDCLVNNAGGVRGVEKVGDIAQQDIETMFNTNVLGLIALTQVVVKQMKARGQGHIINLGSIAGIEAYAGGSIYCATKHAVNAFSKALLKELVSTPLRVTEIQPGMVETEFSVVRFRGDKSAADKVYEGIQPLTAQDIAEEIVWAANRPAHVNIAEMLVFPHAQAGPGLVHRGPFTK